MEPTQLTLRVSGLPPNTQEKDVENFFNDRISRKYGRQLIEVVGPICAQSNRITKCTTVSFSSAKTAQKALGLEETSRRFHAENGGSEIITLDHSFRDLNTIHASSNPNTGRPDIDIIALHGLTGHGWNSFSMPISVNQDAKRTKDVNWLRDILPRLLQTNAQQSIYPRVMTYGYNADVWMTKGVQEIDVPVDNILSHLATERSQDPERPLFFVGHSLGGIVIKQALVALADEALKSSLQEPASSTAGYNFPVKGCMFFGVPNRGSDVASTASGILKLLNTVFNVNRNMIKDLESKSQKLANIASEFRQVRADRKIPVISFFEQQKYGSGLGLIVDKESAIVDYAGRPHPFGVDRNHKNMVKFSDDDAHALEPAVFFLAQLAREALQSRLRRDKNTVQRSLPTPRRVDVEDRFSVLDNYDTVFLVDDSPSMAGERWDLVRKILDYSTTKSTYYDPDGIDVHFLNNKTANEDNIRDPAVAVEIHQRIQLKGSTPLYDQLSRHIRGYMHKFEQRAHDDLNFKSYNLIVLTDGEPDEDYESEDEISDPEDAKITAPAFRLIRKEIVEVAKALDRADAARGQLGIQFCQIGDDPGARRFFEFLDNRLKGKHKLKRDVVDTVPCVSEDDLSEEFFKKLLLGAIDKRVDRDIVAAASGPATATNNHRQQVPHTTPPSQSHTYQQHSYDSYSPPQGQYGYPSMVERHSDPHTTTLHNLPQSRSTPRFSPHLEQYGHQPGPFLPRQSTLPHNPAELPFRPPQRSQTSRQGGWRPAA